MIRGMGRHHRDFSQSEWFHVFNRGADRQDIFSADRDRTLFESLQAEAFDRFEIELHAYALMTNHVHLLVHAPNGGLSEAMQRLCSRYATAYNERTERTGSLFTGRFQSVPITSEAQLIWSGRYIHRNPLDIVTPSTLAAYRWSSLGFLLGKWPTPDWLTTGTLLGANTNPNDYLDYVLTSQPSDRLDHGGLPPLAPTTWDEIEHAVESVMARSSLDADHRPAELRRTLAITIAVETRAVDAAALAELHGLSDACSARRIARRGRVLAAESASFSALRTGVLAKLADTR
jgi:REP element-mobilizing transposase RayT